MSKITNDNLTRSDTGCFIAVPMWQVGVKWLNVPCISKKHCRNMVILPVCQISS